MATVQAAAGALAAAGLGAAIIGIGKTNAEFQDLGLTLQTVFGGIEQGEDALQFIQVFAQKTPFDIQTLSRAFIQLGGAGIAPTEKLLTTFGDAASATTNKIEAFEAMVRIATRAVGGGLGLEELEQLVQQGIPVYQILNDEIGVTRMEISEMGQSAEGAAKIMDALQDGLNKRFGGGMERASNNLSVAFSNMGIAANNVLLALGDGVGGTGLTGAFTFASNTMTAVFEVAKPLAHVIGSVLAGALYAAMVPIRLVAEGLLALGRVMLEIVKFGADYLPDSFKKTKAAIESMDKGLASLEASMNSELETAEGAAETNAEVTAVLDAQALAAKKLAAELAGLSKEEINAFEAAGLLANMEFHDGVMGMPLDLNSDIVSIRAAIAITESYRQKLQELEEDKKQIEEDEKTRAANAKARAAELIAEAERIAQETKSYFQDISSQISSSFVDAVANGQDALKALQNVFNNVVQALIAKALELYVINHIMNAAFGLTGSAKLPTRTVGAAGGGAAYGNQPMLVGERGPELFVPHSAGRIMNNASSKGALGGGSTVVNQTINIETGVSQTVRAEMLSLLPVIKADTMNAVADQNRRGGSYRQALA
jgi:hypothetical protein